MSPRLKILFKTSKVASRRSGCFKISTTLKDEGFPEVFKVDLSAGVKAKKATSDAEAIPDPINSKTISTRSQRASMRRGRKRSLSKNGSGSKEGRLVHTIS